MFNFKNTFLEEYFNPSIGRSIRISLALVLPILWGIFTGNDTGILWVALGAQVVSFVDYSGSYPMKFFIMSITIAFCAIAGFLGIFAGFNWLSATIVMFILAFGMGFVRQSGTHGIGMAIGTLLIFLMTLDHPGDISLAFQTFTAILVGGILALALGLLGWIFTPFSPFKSSVSNTWKAMSEWLAESPSIVKEEEDIDNPTLLDEKELDFREKLNQSLEILSREQAIAHSKRNTLSFRLVELRKIISFTDPAITSFLDAVNHLKQQDHFPDKLILYILENTAQVMQNIAIGISANRPADIYIAQLKIERIKNNQKLLLQNLPESTPFHAKHQLIESLQDIVNYLEEAILILEKISSKSGRISLFMRNLITGMTIPQKFPVVRVQLSFKSYAFRFSLRLALAMALGIAVYKLFKIPHGYWIAMTTMIILQPDYGATYTKAFKRIKGTVLGAIIGSLIFLLPLPLPVSLAIVAVSAFLMPYTMRKNYAVAAFFITIMVIALYHLIEPTTWQLGLVRVLNTLFGAGLAMLGGYAFFPLWERHRVPFLLKTAILSNQYYLENLLSPNPEDMNFVKYRREAEISNFNAFQSLSKMKEEPSHKRANLQLYYILIGYNIRLTRLLKTLSQQHIDEHFFTLKEVENFKHTIAEKLNEAATIISEKQNPKDKTASSETLIQEINESLQSFTEKLNKEETITHVCKRIAKQVTGLYYSVQQIKTSLK